MARLATEQISKKPFVTAAVTPSQRVKQKFPDFNDINVKDGQKNRLMTSSNDIGTAKIIVNINGMTNINNFHNFSLSQQANIKGRKIDMPQLRLGKDMEDNM